MDKLENLDETDGIHFTLDESKTGIINVDIELAASWIQIFEENT